MSKLYYQTGSFASFNNLYSNDMDGVNEYASVPDNSAFSFTDGAGADFPFTWVIWMKRDGVGVNSVLLGKYTNVSGNNAEWYASINASVLRFLVTNNNGTIFVGRTAPMATVGSWVGLAGTYTGSEAASGVKLYTITGGTVTQIDNLNMTGGVYVGMTNGTSPLYIGAINSGGIIWPFNGLQYHPQIYSGALNTTDLATIGTSPHKDARLHTITTAGASLLSAWHFPTGTGDYPTWTDYVSARNATMQNAENTDINTDIP